MEEAWILGGFSEREVIEGVIELRFEGGEVVLSGRGGVFSGELVGGAVAAGGMG